MIVLVYCILLLFYCMIFVFSPALCDTFCYFYDMIQPICAERAVKHQLTNQLKATDLHPANLGSTPAGTNMSHWWRQEGHPAKLAPVCQ